VTKDAETSQQMQGHRNENNGHTQDNDNSIDMVPGSDVRSSLMSPCCHLKYIVTNRHQTSSRQTRLLANVRILQPLSSSIASDPTIADDRSQVLNTEESTTDRQRVLLSSSQAKDNGRSDGKRTCIELLWDYLFPSQPYSLLGIPAPRLELDTPSSSTKRAAGSGFRWGSF
jgi:hypothetical protein